MATISIRLLFLALVTWASLELVDSVDAKLTCATKKQRLDIRQLIKKWNEDSVVLSERISTYATYMGNQTNKTYRLDNEMKTRDGYAKFRIQSGNDTYGGVLIKPKVKFTKRKIRGVFIASVRDCTVKKLTLA